MDRLLRLYLVPAKRQSEDVILWIGGRIEVGLWPKMSCGYFLTECDKLWCKGGSRCLAQLNGIVRLAVLVVRLHRSIGWFADFILFIFAEFLVKKQVVVAEIVLTGCHDVGFLQLRKR